MVMTVVSATLLTPAPPGGARDQLPSASALTHASKSSDGAAAEPALPGRPMGTGCAAAAPSAEETTTTLERPMMAG